MGDINFDGEVDVLDIVQLVNHIISPQDYYDWNLMFFISDLNEISSLKEQRNKFDLLIRDKKILLIASVSILIIFALFGIFL